MNYNYRNNNNIYKMYSKARKSIDLFLLFLESPSTNAIQFDLEVRRNTITIEHQLANSVSKEFKIS